ncbi:MAG: DUF4405 domain-containing protein [Bacteroidales bacterium]|nr:DUF4405 domain-containing protein [Bacteroidales bacterium]
MKRRFFWRSYVSFSLFLSFLAITISGIILYVAPPGRIARWTDWQMLGFNRGQWEDLHTLFSYLFIILGLFHLLMFNWKLFFSYIRSRITSRLNRRREMVFALITFTVIAGFTLAKLPPVYSVMALGNSISSGWAERRGAPPIPHAEEMSFAELSLELLKTDPEVVAEKLREAGYQVRDVNTGFDTIAIQNGKSPAELFDELTKYYRPNILIRERRQIP